MSLILDALKKMDEERKARRGGAVDIRPEILTRRPAPTRAFGRPALAAGALLLLAAGVGTGLLLKGKGTSRTAPATRVARAPSPLVAPMPLPQAASPVPAQPAAAVPTVTPPSAPILPQRAQVVAAQAPPDPLPAEKPRKRRHAADAEAPQDAAATAASEPAPGDLKVSGIAWQDERGLRRAVVNGELVKEGAVVAGARVVAIGERSVRFSRDGRSFTIPYSPGFGGR